MRSKHGISLFIFASALSYFLYHYYSKSTVVTGTAEKMYPAEAPADGFPQYINRDKAPPESGKRGASSRDGQPYDHKPRNGEEPSVAPEGDDTQLSRAYGLGHDVPVFLSHENVNPPLPGLLPTAYLVSADASFENHVKFPNGAVIDIPAAAFEDENGQVLKEKIHISYRQFNDPVSVFLSGIPMIFDSAGTQKLFQTAGMFDWNVTTVSGKRVKIRKDADIRLNMPTIDSAGGYNFYDFNSARGGWEYKAPASSSRSLFSIMADTFSAVYPFDTARLDYCFHQPGYRFILGPGKQEAGYEYTVKHRPNHKDCSLKEKTRIRLDKSKHIYLHAVREPFIKDKKRAYRISFFLKRKYSTQGAFPELVVFNNYKFIVPGLNQQVQFSEKYQRGKTYSDVRVMYENGNDYCTLLLKHDKGTESIKADITQGSEDKWKIFYRLRFERLYAKYQKLLNEKNACYSTQLGKRMEVERLRQAYNLWAVGNAGLNQHYRSISLKGFGLYNVDRLYLMQDPVRVIPVFVNENGEQLNIFRCDVIDSRAKASFSFYANSPFKISPSNTMAIIAYDGGDSMYYLTEREIKGLNWKSGKVLLKMKPLKEIPPDESNLKQLLKG